MECGGGDGTGGGGGVSTCWIEGRLEVGKLRGGIEVDHYESGERGRDSGEGD